MKGAGYYSSGSYEEALNEWMDIYNTGFSLRIT